jgi:hypothetical protein
VCLAVGAVLWLAACSFHTKDRYAVVNSFAAKLDLPAHGTVIKDTHFGRGGISSSPPTRQITLVTVPATKSELEGQLTALGFRDLLGDIPPLVWNAHYENHGLEVRLGYAAAGQELTEAAGGTTVPTGHIAIAVAIQQITDPTNHIGSAAKATRRVQLPGGQSTRPAHRQFRVSGNDGQCGMSAL